MQLGSNASLQPVQSSIDGEAPPQIPIVGIPTPPPMLTVLKSSLISLSPAAFLVLGSPVSVDLHFDAVGQILGLTPAPARSKTAQFIRRPVGRPDGPRRISAMAFIKYYDIDVEVSRQREAYLYKDYLCIDLTQPGTVVTSNRARTGRQADGPDPR